MMFLVLESAVVIDYTSILQIIHVNLTQESPKPLEAGKVLDMTYSIKWIPTNVTFARRFDVYLDYPFFEHQVSSIIDDSFLFMRFLFVTSATKYFIYLHNSCIRLFCFLLISQEL